MPVVIDSKKCLSLRSLQRLTQKDGDEPTLRRWADHLAICTHCSQAAVALKLQGSILAAVSSIDHDGELLQTLADRFEVDLHEGEDYIPSLEDLPPKQEFRRPTPKPATTEPTTIPLSARLLELLRPPQSKDELGRIGGYRLLKVLGAGAVGVVFLAEDIALKRKVALKLLNPNDLDDKIARERFLREGRAVAALDHPNIVSVYQVGEDNNVPFMAMQFLEGETLDDCLKRQKTLKILDAIAIAKEIATGLVVAHERGMVHRDIKPANIWLEGRTGRVKILDFGLARSLSDDIQLTRTGYIVGTPAYMSPEQAKGSELDQRSDLYSLGCILYVMCAGVPPIHADDMMGMLLALATDQPRPILSFNPEVPPPLVGLINRLLAKHPQARPATAKEVISILETIEKVLPQLMPGDVRQQWVELQQGRRDTGGVSLVTIALWSLILLSLSIMLLAFITPDGWTKNATERIMKWVRE